MFNIRVTQTLKSPPFRIAADELYRSVGVVTAGPVAIGEHMPLDAQFARQTNQRCQPALGELDHGYPVQAEMIAVDAGQLGKYPELGLALN